MVNVHSNETEMLAIFVIHREQLPNRKQRGKEVTPERYRVDQGSNPEAVGKRSKRDTESKHGDTQADHGYVTYTWLKCTW